MRSCNLVRFERYHQRSGPITQHAERDTLITWREKNAIMVVNLPLVPLLLAEASQAQHQWLC